MPDVSVHPLPMRVEDITPAWLTSAVRTQSPRATVLGARIVDINRGTCTKIRYELELDDAARVAGIPRRVILKGGFEPHSRDLYLIHEMEVRGYRDVFGGIGLPSPGCYFADFDAEQRQGIVIMEDLVVRGVDFCVATRPQSFEQVARRLEVLARFHAKTWNSPELDKGRWDWTDRGMPSIRDSYIERYFHADVWQGFVTSPRGAASSVHFHDMQWATQALDALVRLSDSLPHVVLHGDAHLGNVYIDPDGSPGFYDPMSHRDHAMRDVGYHIAGALDIADRRRWEGPLIQHYLAELRRNGVDAPSFDETMRIYAAYLALGFIIFLVNDTKFQTEAINTANAARYSAAMIDNDTVNVLNSIP